MKLDLSKYHEDDICDVYENRLCDNCGDCLFTDGKDSRAINIESIAKNLEENKYLEEEYKKMIEMIKEEHNYEEEASNKKEEEYESEENTDLDYVDAFDNIVYIDDLEYLEEDFDDDTEEVFPGFRRLKKK